MPAEATDVLIVGAGPTGMALSIALHQRGVDHVLIDKLEQGHHTSRAGVIHAHTLDALTELGVADRLADLGLKLTKFTIRDRDRALLRLRFDRLPSPHPYLLMLPQNVTEGVLAARIAELGGTILRGAVAKRVEQDAAGVQVTVDHGGRERCFSARYVVGADGMHSVVRQAAGTEFEGGTYGDSFVLADVHLDWPLADEVSLFFSPAGLVVVAPLPNGTFRVVATVEEAPERPALADIQALIDARGPRGGNIRVRDVAWSSRFRLHHRLARSYQQGRLLLMGDAAHVHSPAGGQGMNTGIVDAVVLGRLLADVVTGTRVPAELGLYGSLRRPAAEQVLGLAGRLTTMATLRSPLQRWLRNAVLWLVNVNERAKRRLELQLSGIARASLASVDAAHVVGTGPTITSG